MARIIDLPTAAKEPPPNERRRGQYPKGVVPGYRLVALRKARAHAPAAALEPQETPSAPLFAAAIDGDSMLLIEEASGDSARRQQRRSTLTLVARDQRLLQSLASDRPEAWQALAASARAYREHARELLELAEAACERVDIIEAAQAVAR